MATTSTVALINKDGSVTSCYVHWDGYLDHMGRILHDHFNLSNINDILDKHPISFIEVDNGVINIESYEEYDEPTPIRHSSLQKFLETVNTNCVYILDEKSQKWFTLNHIKQMVNLDLELEKSNGSYFN